MREMRASESIESVASIEIEGREMKASRVLAVKRSMRALSVKSVMRPMRALVPIEDERFGSVDGVTVVTV